MQHVNVVTHATCRLVACSAVDDSQFLLLNLGEANAELQNERWIAAYTT